MYLELDETLRSRYPGLLARMLVLRKLPIREFDPKLEAFKLKIYKETRSRWDLDGLKESKVFRCYRDFFWKVGVDPTKIRPASEALIRRVLHGNPLPRINTLVDAYNLASITITIPFGAFDLDRLNGNLIMREAKPGEEFLGIGMDKTIQLNGGEPVVQDENKLIAVYPYRDADYSKVTTLSKNILLMTCGVPSIGDNILFEAEKVAVDYITQYNDGVLEE